MPPPIPDALASFVRSVHVRRLRLASIRELTTVSLLGLLTSPAALAGPRNVSDGSIRVQVPAGWHTSVAPGIQSTHRVAWILLGDFPLAADAATLEGGPLVPRQQILVSIGDFLPLGPAATWPRVGRLALPAKRLRHRVVWNVRFADRALRLIVTFGSKPTTNARRSVNAVLAGVRPA
jgi:hypothetical protein